MKKILSLILVGMMIATGFVGLLSLTSENAEAAGLADSAWPMFHGNARHTGLSPYDTSSNTGTLKWKYETEYSVDSSPAIGSDGTIYVGSLDSYLYAINPDGTLKWRYQTGGDVRSSPAIGSDGIIYVGSGDHYLYAINPDGTLKWKYQTGNWVSSSPAIGSDGTIYVGSWDNYLYAINPDGTLKWRYQTGDDVFSSPAIGSDGTVYVGSDDNYLYAINPDGTLKWKYQTGAGVGSSPAIGSDGTVYVGSYDDYIYAINPDGTLKWRYQTGDDVFSSPAIGSDGTIYVGSLDSYLYAINPDGTLKWRYETGNVVNSSPAIGSDGTIYVGSGENKLYAINPDGTLKWKYQTGINLYSSPAIGSDGTIYVGSDDNCLYAIGTNGTTPNPATSAPSAPQNLRATAGNTQVQLSWNAPSDDGGSAITGYKIYRGTSSGNEVYLTTVTGTSYTDAGVSNGQTYYYQVSAVNSDGEGAKSGEVSVTVGGGSTSESGFDEYDHVLPVPFLNQPATNWCFPTAVSEVMRYYGVETHPWELAEDINLPAGHGTGGDDIQLNNPMPLFTDPNAFHFTSWRHYIYRNAGLTYEYGGTDYNPNFDEMKEILNNGPVIFANNPLLKTGHAWIITGYRDDPGGERGFYQLNNNNVAGGKHINFYYYISWGDFQKKYMNERHYMLYNFKQDPQATSYYGSNKVVSLSLTTTATTGGIETEDSSGKPVESLYMDRGIKWQKDNKPTLTLSPGLKLKSPDDGSFEITNVLNGEVDAVLEIDIKDSHGNVVNQASMDVNVPARSKAIIDISPMNLRTPTEEGMYSLDMKVWNKNSDGSHGQLLDRVGPIAFAIGNPDESSVWNKITNLLFQCPVDVTITNSQNQTAKVVDGKIYNDVSWAMVFTKGDHKIFYLKPDEYKVEINGMDDGAYNMITNYYRPDGQYGIEIDHVNTTQGTADTFSVPENPSNLKLVSDYSGDRLCEIKAYKQTETAQFSGDLALASSDFSDVMLDVNNVSLSNRSYMLEIKDWDHLTSTNQAPAVLYEDTNMDGTYDTTAELKNTPKSGSSVFSNAVWLIGIVIIAIIAIILTTMLVHRKKAKQSAPVVEQTGFNPQPSLQEEPVPQQYSPQPQSQSFGPPPPPYQGSAQYPPPETPAFGPPPIPTTYEGSYQHSRPKPTSGKCSVCGSRNLTFNDDGTGKCLDCGRTFWWDKAMKPPES